MISSSLRKEYAELIRQSDCRLFGHPPLSMQQQLAAISELADAYGQQDYYGQGELIESFETEIATMVGKDAAVFLPSGTMGQCIALRIWSESRRSPYVGFHPRSHLELHEHKAYQALHGLHGVLIGNHDQVVSLEDIQAATDPLAAMLVELPMREIGGQLPEWEDLQAQSAWLRGQDIAFHLDGARLWQCTPHYGRSLADIASLFDSLYLSFYKDIGGIAGSVLAGSTEFISNARTWVRRCGGNLYSLYPYVLAARAGIQRNLSALPTAVDFATWLAPRLNAVDGMRTLPAEPPTNLFHLQVEGSAESLIEKALDWGQRHQAVILPMPRAEVAAVTSFEFSVGRCAESVSREQWQRWLEDFAGLLA